MANSLPHKVPFRKAFFPYACTLGGGSRLVIFFVQNTVPHGLVGILAQCQQQSVPSGMTLFCKIRKEQPLFISGGPPAPPLLTRRRRSGLRRHTAYSRLTRTHGPMQDDLPCGQFEEFSPSRGIVPPPPGFPALTFPLLPSFPAGSGSTGRTRLVDLPLGRAGLLLLQGARRSGANPGRGFLPGPRPLARPATAGASPYDPTCSASGHKNTSLALFEAAEGNRGSVSNRAPFSVDQG